MTLPPQLNFFTLACQDVARVSPHRVFQLPNPVVLALYGADNYEPH